jgi:cell division protein FtsX
LYDQDSSIFGEMVLCRLASMLVMTITLFVIGSIIFTSVLLNTALIQIKDKVDINVYFVTTADEGDIFQSKNPLKPCRRSKKPTHLASKSLQNLKSAMKMITTPCRP